MSNKATKSKEKSNLAQALENLKKHSLLKYLANKFHGVREDDTYRYVGKDGWAAVSQAGSVYVRKGAAKFGTVAEWEWVLAHIYLASAFSGIDESKEFKGLTPRQLTALLIEADRLASIIKAGTPPVGLEIDSNSLPTKPWKELVACIPPKYPDIELAGTGYPTLFAYPLTYHISAWGVPRHEELEHALAKGIAEAAAASIKSVALHKNFVETKGALSKKRIMDKIPLLASCIALFDIIEDADICKREGIDTAAVAPYAGEIYLNPAVTLTPDETDFILAHEVLHASLNHLGRRQGRDPLIWNYACDFIVNGWLIEMHIGKPPYDILYDKDYTHLSVEALYDFLVKQTRLTRKLQTFAGCKPDLLEHGDKYATVADAANALAQGSRYWKAVGRGLLPGGLEEEIRAIETPPAPWDASLANWLTARFQPDEKHRTYARISRRQFSTPDIPRPGKIVVDMERTARVLGAIVDTSASMDRTLLGKAIGAISSTALSLNIDYVRLIWCDTAPVDEGWRAPENLWGKLKAKGRGGTVLQPAFDYLHNLALKKEVPEKLPVLLITDGYCEAVLNVYGFDTAALIPTNAPKPEGVPAVFKFE